MDKKRILTIAILALGVLLIIAGMILIVQAGTDHTGYNGGISRASTSIEFGGDFYTRSAQYTALAANAATDLYALVSISTGIFFVFIGGIEVCLTLLLTDAKELIKKKELVKAEATTPNLTE